MRHFIQRLLAPLALTFLALTATLAPAQAQDAKQNVILVLDASGSMWGQIDGVSKIEIAREQIAGMLDGWDAEQSLGLMAYGHRSKGDCADIEMVLPPGKLDAATFQSAVNKISPKGKTPLSDAVRQAAEQLKYTEEAATVVLLSDGLENCEADPCALGAALEADGVDFTAHVIGFDISEGEAGQLSCLAENTGGEFYLAGDAAALTQSLQQTVQRIAEPAPAPEPTPVVQPEPVEEPEPAGPQGLRGLAKLCADCDILDQDVFWRLYEAEQDINGKRKEIARDGKAQPIFELAAGEYFIQVQYGAAFAGQVVTIEPDTLTEATLTLNAGLLRLAAEASPGGTDLEDSMFYWVYENKTDLQGNREEVSRDGNAKPLFRLPAGEYYVTARHGAAYTSEVLIVLPGELTEFTFDMDVAYLRLKAVATEGGEELTDNQFYWVYDAKTDLQGNRTEITRDGNATPLFRLSAGDYHIVARHGSAYSTMDISLEPDTLTDRVMDMNVGYVRMKSVMAEGAAPIAEDTFYWVYEAKTDLQGNRKEVTREGRAEPLFRLPAGDYHVVARHGASRISHDLTVVAGELQDITLVQNSARIKVTTALEEGGAPLTGDLFYWVMSADTNLEGERTEITRDGGASPLLTLKADDYVIRVRHAGETYDFPISLTPGEESEVNLVLN